MACRLLRQIGTHPFEDQKRMKTLPLLALMAAAAVGTAARAEVSSTVTLASDYDFRGISQSAKDPSLQLSLDWAGESGFYVGGWASNVDFGPDTASDVELDIYAGYTGNITDDFTYDFSVTQYSYFDRDDKVDYAEAAFGLAYQGFSTKFWYAWDYGNTGLAARYVEANLELPLPKDFGLLLHAGQSSGEYWADDKYTDYAIGLTKTVGKFDLTLKWIDGSDYRPGNNVDGNVFSSDSKAFISVATSFPWE